jgi:hypothetical protein
LLSYSVIYFFWLIEQKQLLYRASLYHQKNWPN